MLKLIFITNNINLAKCAELAGVNRIMIDLETLGKKERQKGRNTLISEHSIEDIKSIRAVINSSEIIVRINPININSKSEIDDVIEAGADIIMLPMFRTKREVEEFLDIVDGRTKSMLLFEHIEAVNNIDEILNLSGIDELHIGLNDLHISMDKTFMFELFTDNTVQYIVEKAREKNIPVGIGGMSRMGTGDLPAELILTEHYRLNSSGVILSRGFLDNINIKDMNQMTIQKTFCDNVASIREKEKILEKESFEFFEQKHKQLIDCINNIVERMRVLTNE